MKKLISISLILLMIISLSLTSFAARPAYVDGNAQLRLDVVELENTVQVTGVLVGLMAISSYQLQAAYNPANLTPATYATPDVGFTAGANSTYLLGSDYFTAAAGWNSTYAIDFTGAIAAPYASWKPFRFTQTKTSAGFDTISSSVEKIVFRVLFNKVGGFDATADSILIIKAGLQEPLVKGDTALGGTVKLTAEPTLFTKTFTNYVAPVTGKAVTYATTGSTSGAAPTDATLYASGATVTVADAGTLVKDKYTFAGWNDGTDTYAVGASYTMPATAVTFTPVWTAKPVADLPIVPGDVVKADGTGSKDTQDNILQYKDKVTGLPKAIDAPVVTIAGKVPASVTEANIDSHEFGVIFGGVKFKSKSTWAGLGLNFGKYIIKLVDPSGTKIPAGKYNAVNYLDNDPTGTTEVTISN